MKVKQLNRLAKIVDKGNEILECIGDLNHALKLISSDDKTMVTIAVSNRNDIISLTDHIIFSDDLWVDIINERIKELRKEFKRLRVR